MKLLASIISGLLLAAGAAQAAQAQPPAASASQNERAFYYWLHPKMGMVKVDRATNAIITTRQARAQTADASGAQGPAKN